MDLPRIVTLAPINTLLPTFGCLSPLSLPVEPACSEVNMKNYDDIISTVTIFFLILNLHVPAPLLKYPLTHRVLLHEELCNYLLTQQFLL